METVFPEAGLKVYVAEPTAVPNEVPFVLVCTDNVCVRVAHAAAGGSFKVTLPTANVEPRSACTHCGNALLALSQYVLASPSVTVDAACVPLTWVDAVAGRPAATLVAEPIPLPLRATVNGLLPARARLPVRVPEAVGRNVTVTVQEAPTARDPQLLVWLKSPAVVTPETVAAAVPSLVTVTVCDADALPTTVAGKATDDGSEVTRGPAATPLPDSGTVLVMPAAVTVRFPAREPVAEGVNRTLTVQDAPAASDDPQVFVWLKSPDTATPETGAVPEPELVTVTVCAALVDRVAIVPKPSAVGLIEMAEPLSGRYGGNVGVGMVDAADPEKPELPPPSVSVKPTPQL